jgi:ribonuclease P protein subunit POP4
MADEETVIPKEHTIFRFWIPLIADDEFEQKEKDGEVGKEDCFVFELHGEQFKNRAAERARKKFRLHLDPGL